MPPFRSPEPPRALSHQNLIKTVTEEEEVGEYPEMTSSLGGAGGLGFISATSEQNVSPETFRFEEESPKPASQTASEDLEATHPR